MSEQVIIEFEFNVGDRVREVFGERVGKVFSRSYFDSGDSKRVQFIVEWDNGDTTISCNANEIDKE